MAVAQYLYFLLYGGQCEKRGLNRGGNLAFFFFIMGGGVILGKFAPQFFPGNDAPAKNYNRKHLSNV